MRHNQQELFEIIQTLCTESLKAEPTIANDAFFIELSSWASQQVSEPIRDMKPRQKTAAIRSFFRNIKRR